MTRRGDSRPVLSGWAGLAVAVLALAAHDVAEGNACEHEARGFLLSPWAADLLRGACDVLDVDGLDVADLDRLALGGEN